MIKSVPSRQAFCCDHVNLNENKCCANIVSFHSFDMMTECCYSYLPGYSKLDKDRSGFNKGTDKNWTYK